MHKLAVLGAIGHGSESGMYFQIRQSRGSAEKFHSAVISHVGTEHTRVYQEVKEVGSLLEQISDQIYGSVNKAEVAIIYDKESKWALDLSAGPRNQGLDYDRVCAQYYKYFWAHGIGVDVVDSRDCLENYRIIIAPMLYMFHSDIQEKLRTHVQKGGFLLTTALSGLVNDTDLCFLGEATKEKLSDVLGMWVEEYDGLFDDECNQTNYHGKTYLLKDICEIVHTTTAEPLATYEKDFYQGFPVITQNRYGEGKAFHITANCEDSLATALCQRIAKEAGVAGIFGDTEIPEGIGIVCREKENKRYIFIGNYTENETAISLPKADFMQIKDMLTHQSVVGTISVKAYGIVLLEESNPQPLNP